MTILIDQVCTKPARSWNNYELLICTCIPGIPVVYKVLQWLVLKPCWLMTWLLWILESVYHCKLSDIRWVVPENKSCSCSFFNTVDRQSPSQGLKLSAPNLILISLSFQLFKKLRARLAAGTLAGPKSAVLLENPLYLRSIGENPLAKRALK